jgi:hypothetical protein
VLDITFNPSTSPDFSLTASPISVAVAQGGSANATATTAVSGGFNSAVSLSASGLPAGASYSFTPASISAPGSGSSTLALTAGATTTPGTYSVILSGTGGGKTHTASVSFNVNASGGGATALSNGVPVTVSVNSTSADSSYKDFSIAVPSNASNLAIATSASTGDVDLYVKFGATPSLTLYDCRPYTSSGNESCSFASPSTGTYYIRVYGYQTGSISFNVTASYSTGGGTATERLLNGGFESGAASWTLASAFNVATSGSFPHAGVGNAYNSATNSSTGSIYQTVAISATATAATLSFWLNVVTQESTTATSAYDTLTVQVKDAAGATLGTLATYSNLNNKDNGNIAGSYTKKSFSLLAYKGKTVRIYFGSSTDVSYPTTFRIDDASLLADGP